MDCTLSYDLPSHMRVLYGVHKYWYKFLFCQSSPTQLPSALGSTPQRNLNRPGRKPSDQFVFDLDLIHGLHAFLCFAVSYACLHSVHRYKFCSVSHLRSQLPPALGSTPGRDLNRPGSSPAVTLFSNLTSSMNCTLSYALKLSYVRLQRRKSKFCPVSQTSCPLPLV